MTLKNDGVPGVLSPKQGNKIEVVVLNRECILEFFVRNKVRVSNIQQVTDTQILVEYFPRGVHILIHSTRSYPISYPSYLRHFFHNFPTEADRGDLYILQVTFYRSRRYRPLLAFLFYAWVVVSIRSVSKENVHAKLEYLNEHLARTCKVTWS